MPLNRREAQARCRRKGGNKAERISMEETIRKSFLL
jgi:hypothetical protein